MIFYLGILLLLLLLPRGNKRIGIRIFFLIVGGLSAVRYNVGYDYTNYLDIILGRNAYAIAYDRLEPIGKLLIDASKYVEYPQLFFILSSLIIFAGIAFWIYKESEDYKLSILIFMGLPMFFWASLSIVRQFMAIAFGVLFFHSVLSQKYRQSYLWLALASLSHVSALVLAVAYILKKELTFSRYVLIYASSFVLGFAFYRLINWGAGILILEKAQIFIQKNDLKGFRNQIILFNGFFLTYLLFLWESRRISYSSPFYSQVALVGVFLLNTLSFAPVFAGRISSFFLISFVVLFPNEIRMSPHRVLYRLLAVPLCIFFYVYTLYLASSSFEAGLTSKDPYIPYQTYFDKF